MDERGMMMLCSQASDAQRSRGQTPMASGMTEKEQLLLARVSQDQAAVASGWPQRVATRTGTVVLAVLVTLLVLLASWRYTEGLSMRPGLTTSLVALAQSVDCSPEGSDCASTRCCNNVDWRCYQKNSTYAECRASCARGEHADEAQSSWSCTVLSNGKAKVAATTEAGDPVVLVPAVKTDKKQATKARAVKNNSGSTTTTAAPTPNCSDTNEDCTHTRCCLNSNMTCFEKNQYWSGCLPSCDVGIHPEDEESVRTPWSCDSPAEAKPGVAPPPAPPAGADLGSPSLFCFAACINDDEVLLRSQMHKRAGIFACNEYRIFSNRDGTRIPNAQFMPQVAGTKGVPGALTATWVNAPGFVIIWETLANDGTFLRHEWVVKADPDCVFVPSKLRQHLREPQFASPANVGTGVYLKNCAAGPRGLQLFGSIEVVSKNAVLAMKNAGGICRTKIDFTLMGEDMWLQKCLDLSLVTPIGDYGRLVADGYCPGAPPLEPCIKGFLAYHPMKLPEQWLKCWHEANSV